MGEYHDEEDDGEWSGSSSYEISLDALDSN